jgi:hypothetical protein
MKSLRDQTKSTLYKSWICNERLNQLHCFKNVLVKNPNFLTTTLETYDDHTIIYPYDEKVMSFGSIQVAPTICCCDITISKTESNPETNPVYFFLYNFSNYYHFIYDTLPYLFGFLYIKQFVCPSIKLLVINPKEEKYYKFVLDTFELLGLKEDDFYFINKLNTLISSSNNSSILFEQLFISTSLTYGKSSDDLCVANNKFSDDAKIIWEALIKLSKERCIPPYIHPYLKLDYKERFPKRFYVSRRTHIHGDNSNIGTNYTNRRKCMNEDDLVKLCETYKIREIFCETLNMEEKIFLFLNAELVIGFAGGGLTNLVFSPSSTRVICVNTPEFLKINQRFLHCISHTDYTILDNTKLVSHSFNSDKPAIPLYVRVKLKETGLIGEIESYSEDDQYIVKVSNNDVPGFSADSSFPTIKVSSDMFETLDNGINSPFECDLTKLEDCLKSIDKDKYIHNKIEHM